LRWGARVVRDLATKESGCWTIYWPNKAILREVLFGFEPSNLTRL
jgi:hypothetical protein